MTRADVAKPAGPTSPRKRKSKLSEGTEESGAFGNQEKQAEPEDTQSSWRMRLRERPVSESSTPEEQHSRKRRGSERSRKSSTTSLTDVKEESHSPLVISTSPSTEIQKVRIKFIMLILWALGHDKIIQCVNYQLHYHEPISKLFLNCCCCSWPS